MSGPGTEVTVAEQLKSLLREDEMMRMGGEDEMKAHQDGMDAIVNRIIARANLGEFSEGKFVPNDRLTSSSQLDSLHGALNAAISDATQGLMTYGNPSLRLHGEFRRHSNQFSIVKAKLELQELIGIGDPSEDARRPDGFVKPHVTDFPGMDGLADTFRDICDIDSVAPADIRVREKEFLTNFVSGMKFGSADSRLLDFSRFWQIGRELEQLANPADLNTTIKAPADARNNLVAELAEIAKGDSRIRSSFQRTSLGIEIERHLSKQ